MNRSCWSAKFVQPRWDFKVYFTWGTYYVRLLTLLTPVSQDETMKQARIYIFEEGNHHMAEQIAMVHPVLLLPIIMVGWSPTTVKDVSLDFLALALQCRSHYHFKFVICPLLQKRWFVPVGKPLLSRFPNRERLSGTKGGALLSRVWQPGQKRTFCPGW